ncbi:lipoprotein [Spiroplasma endosymbiont of Dioctria linearis]|uniref:lipoprotein n=1 Tax=Spiroplasma endosymbiont of Dioctria linearis TaxID=3066290 RepID=UPI00313D3870
MKKLLSLLGGVSLIATSAITVAACGETTPPIIVEDISGVINDLKVETNEIFKKHLETNVYKNLIGLEETEKGNGNWMWNDRNFIWITDNHGISPKWNKTNYNINNSIILFDLDYINLYIDLAQITMGTKTLDEKHFIKFSK